jgi:hypothetical protein
MLLCIRLLRVSAFSAGRHQVIQSIRHKCVYREILFASSQIYMNSTVLFKCCSNLILKSKKIM